MFAIWFFSIFELKSRNVYTIYHLSCIYKHRSRLTQVDNEINIVVNKCSNFELCLIKFPIDRAKAISLLLMLSSFLGQIQSFVYFHLASVIWQIFLKKDISFFCELFQIRHLVFCWYLKTEISIGLVDVIFYPRSQRAGSYKFGTVIVNGSQWVSQSVSKWVS